MPMHDWTRVEAGMFHDFHGRWLYQLADVLNEALLPGDYYALVDQKLTGALGIGPDILTLDPTPPRPKRATSRSPVKRSRPAAAATLTAVAKSPRQVGRRRILVRHVSGHQIVSLVELVSPGNKESPEDFAQFVEKLAAALQQGIHLTVIDPFPPTVAAADGVPAALWKRLHNRGTLRLPADRPLEASAFEVGPDKLRAFVEPFAVGQPVPDIPLFLHDGAHVRLPLEETYTRAFAAYPRLWRNVLTA